MSTRKRRHYGETAKTKSGKAIAAGIVSAVSLGFYALAVFLTAQNEGESGNVLSGIAVMAMVFAIICAFTGVREWHDKTRTVLSRLFGVTFPMLAVVVFVGTYLFGVLL